MTAACAYDVCAQELPATHNQIWFELVGNNFLDPNSNADGGPFSIGYSCKMVYPNSAFIFSLGVGEFRGIKTDQANNTHFVTNISVPAGIYWRFHYKRYGFWPGIFYTSAFGPINYVISNSAPPISFDHKYSFQVIPNVMYMYQTRKEHFFIQIKYCPRILASTFSNHYGDERKLYLPWGGITIGGAW